MTMLGQLIATSLCIAAVLTQQVLAADDPQHTCWRTIKLQPNQSVDLAIAVNNDSFLYTSIVVSVIGRVQTEDGINRLALVWLKHSDVFRWGKNIDLATAVGPGIDIRQRVGLLFKGSAELRAKAVSSVTTLCLCTPYDMDDAQGNEFVRRRDACMNG